MYDLKDFKAADHIPAPAGMDARENAGVPRQDGGYRHLRRQGQLGDRRAVRRGVWPRKRPRRPHARRRPARHRLLQRHRGLPRHQALHLQHPRRHERHSGRDDASRHRGQPPDHRQPPLPHPHGDAVRHRPERRRGHRGQHLQPLRGLGRLLHHLRRQRGRVLAHRDVHHRGGHRHRPRAGPARALPHQAPVRRPDRKTDEDNLGIAIFSTTRCRQERIRPKVRGVADPAIKEQIDHKHRVSRFKFETIPVYHNGLPIVIEDGTDFYK